MDALDVTILIIDDNPANARFAQLLLAKGGYRTVTASSGKEGIGAARRLHPDLILLDIFMPEICGIEVCRSLQKDQRTRDIPIIFLTANTDDHILKTAFECGGRDYVRKPVNKTELLVRINSVLARERLKSILLTEEKLKGVLEMAGAVCHELNQPIQAASGYCQLLMMDMTPNHPFNAGLANISRQIARMSGITRKLMRITRYASKEYILGHKIIDIDNAVADPPPDQS